jgi:hypothetical protein
MRKLAGKGGPTVIRAAQKLGAIFCANELFRWRAVGAKPFAPTTNDARRNVVVVDDATTTNFAVASLAQS